MRHLVGIVGYRGYSGAELVSILRAHPHVRPVLMEHRAASDGVGDSGIRAGGAKALHEIPATPDAVRAEKIEIVFTGIRSGEKLSEELSLDSEQVDATAHPKILVARRGASDRQKNTRAGTGSRTRTPNCCLKRCMACRNSAATGSRGRAF